MKCASDMGLVLLMYTIPEYMCLHIAVVSTKFPQDGGSLYILVDSARIIGITSGETLKPSLK